jgi:quercetin dioxygenase-like cupin family protein
VSCSRREPHTSRQERGKGGNHARDDLRGLGHPPKDIIVAMITRRDSLAGAVALLCGMAAANAKAESSKAAPPSQSGTDLVFQHDLPNITMDDWEVTVSQVDYPPGRVGKIHHHAGFVLAYILEGNIVTKVSGQEERTYKPGEMFFEPPGSTHEVSRNASETQPGKLLALIFAKKGAQLTMPGPA